MAARTIDEDPALAHRHALAAERRAGRVPVVRETVAITAYQIGDFALALRELRTYRRMSGSLEHVALEVDSERGLERPARGLELGRGVDRSAMSAAARAALAIAMSGARLDLGEPERALEELGAVDAQPDRAFSWSAGLFHAYAEVLAELGRDEESARWRARASAAEQAWEEQFAGQEILEVETEFEDAQEDGAGRAADDSDSAGGDPPAPHAEPGAQSHDPQHEEERPDGMAEPNEG